ncbi:hypothetical protein [uncultured Bifidobacterium sp.]|nr:hypothetical protein [uncultured Bifidobacterium sp.]
MDTKEFILLALLIVVLVTGIVAGCLWLIAQLKPLLGILLLFFLVAAG